MNRLIHHLLCIILVPWAGFSAPTPKAYPQLPRELDLETAVALALENNPDYLRTQEQLNEQAGRLREIKGPGRPRVKVNSDYSAYDDNRQQSFGSGSPPEDTRWGADAELSLIVFSGGRQQYRVRSERESTASVNADAWAARQDMIARAHEAYYNAQFARENVQVQVAAIEVFTEQRDFSDRRLQSGVGDRFELMQAEVALANAQPPLIRARNDVRRNIDELRRTLGLAYAPNLLPSEVQLDPVPEPNHLDIQLRDAIEMAAVQRPELEALARRVGASRYQWEATRREKRPVVDVFAGYGVESDQFGDGDELEGWTAGVRLTWDLLDGGSIRGRAEQVASQTRQLEFESKALALDISGEVRNAFYDYEEARSILDANEQAVEQAAEALRLAQNRFEAGRGTQLDVLESQLQLTRSRLERSSALNALQRAVVNVKRAVGLKL